MRYETVTKRIGENVGPVDWSYDFRQHFDCYCTSDAGRDEACEKAKEKLRQLLDGGDWEATTYGGWPRCGWGSVVDIGMYDGWPYWKPVPSVCIMGPLGGQWSAFSFITDIRKLTENRE